MKIKNFGAMIALSLVLVSLQTAFAADWIVRYRDPQDSTRQAQGLMNQTLGAGQVKATVLNSAEGLVKVTFANDALAQTALEALEKSDRVLSVTPNSLFHSALKLTVREAVEEKQSFFGSFLRLLGALAGNPEVLLPPATVNPGPDLLATKDWAWDKIHMPSSVEIDSNHPAVITAVIDTGVDYNHEDLVGAMWRSPADPHEVGYDFAHGVARPYDQMHFDLDGCMKDKDCATGADQSKFLVNPGHGTHCAGHVGAVVNNSLGIRGMGAQAAVKIMALKFFFDAGEKNAGSGDTAAAIQSIDYAIRNGAKVISASWGSLMKREDAEKSELKKAIVRAQKAGVLMVIAAGNDGKNNDEGDQADFPAAYDLDNLIVVAATDPLDQIADFSNFGKKSVHIGAPGVKIFSTMVASKYDDAVARFKDAQGKTYELDWDGTSMAAPIVAGAVALVWSKFPNEDYHQIRNRILLSARKVPGLQGFVSTDGVLDVSAALAR